MAYVVYIPFSCLSKGYRFFSTNLFAPIKILLLCLETYFFNFDKHTLMNTFVLVLKVFHHQSRQRIAKTFRRWITFRLGLTYVRRRRRRQEVANYKLCFKNMARRSCSLVCLHRYLIKSYPSPLVKFGRKYIIFIGRVKVTSRVSRLTSTYRFSINKHCLVADQTSIQYCEISLDDYFAYGNIIWTWIDWFCSIFCNTVCYLTYRKIGPLNASRLYD